MAIQSPGPSPGPSRSQGRTIDRWKSGHGYPQRLLSPLERDVWYPPRYRRRQHLPGQERLSLRERPSYRGRSHSPEGGYRHLSCHQRSRSPVRRYHSRSRSPRRRSPSRRRTSPPARWERSRSTARRYRSRSRSPRRRSPYKRAPSPSSKNIPPSPRFDDRRPQPLVAISSIQATSQADIKRHLAAEVARYERSDRLPRPPETPMSPPQKAIHTDPPTVTFKVNTNLPAKRPIASIFETALNSTSNPSPATQPINKFQLATPTPSSPIPQYTMIGTYLVPAGVPTLPPPPTGPSEHSTTVPLPRKARPAIVTTYLLRNYFVGPGGSSVRQLQDMFNVNLNNRRQADDSLEIFVQARAPITAGSERKAGTVWKGIKAWAGMAEGVVRSKGRPLDVVGFMRVFKG